MSRLSDEVEVTLAKEACPICCKPMDGPILIGKKISKQYAENVDKMNGQLIDWADKPCSECKKLIDEGCFFIIGVNGSKTTNPKKPYRSGHIIGITKECDFYKFLPEDSKKCDAILMDYRNMIELRLINEA